MTIVPRHLFQWFLALVVFFAVANFLYGLVLPTGWAIGLGLVTTFAAWVGYGTYNNRRWRAFHENFEARAYGAEEVGRHEIVSGQPFTSWDEVEAYLKANRRPSS